MHAQLYLANSPDLAEVQLKISWVQHTLKMHQLHNQ